LTFSDNCKFSDDSGQIIELNTSDPMPYKNYVGRNQRRLEFIIGAVIIIVIGYFFIKEFRDERKDR